MDGSMRGNVLGGFVAAMSVMFLGANRPDLYSIPLEGVGPSSRMAGTATLTPARSPFGIATTAEGFFVLNIRVEAPQLPPPSSFGPAYTTFVAWVADNNLERVERLGTFLPGGSVGGKVTMNKYLVVITAEPAAAADRWTGPIVLRGRSPSSYLTNFSGHTMFNGGMPQ
jgi:hypothetical protein